MSEPKLTIRYVDSTVVIPMNRIERIGLETGGRDGSTRYNLTFVETESGKRYLIAGRHPQIEEAMFEEQNLEIVE